MSLALTSPGSAAPAVREADCQAASNWKSNLTALQSTQPALAASLRSAAIDATWIFGRDGSLTAQNASGAWWAGCSVPLAAAKAMLRTMGTAGPVTCFLRPPTAAAVGVALDKLRQNQAVLAIVPDLAEARVMLHCADFAADLRERRLWLAVGDGWDAQLAHLLRQLEGLPTPSQFIRLTDGHEEIAEAMIPQAQRSLSAIAAERAVAVGELQCTAGAGPACVVAPTHFRLWDDAGHALAQVASQLGWPHLDPDNPTRASPLALARAAAGASAVVMPNNGRADLPNLVAMRTPWITWLTGPRVPGFAGAGPRDALLVADAAWRDAAVAQGWPASRVQVATWPDDDAPSAPPSRCGHLLIACDIVPLDPPRQVVEMSSHRLLWDAIADELLRDPLAVGPSVLDYLRQRTARANIASLDERRFIDELIAPAYALGLAMLLQRAGVPLRLAGAGWDAIEPLAPLAIGPVTTRAAFREAVASAAALVHAWPTAGGHPIDHQGRPVVRASGGREALLRDARLAAAGSLSALVCADPPISAELLKTLVSRG